MLTRYLRQGDAQITCGVRSSCFLRVKKRRPFKYVNAIGSLPSFLPKIKEYWDGTVRLYHSTSAMYRFSKKLKNLKPLIRELGREQLGNLSKRAKEAFRLLCDKQSATLSNPKFLVIQKETEAYDKWLNVASLEEDFLKQKAKLHWLDVGDHRTIKTREAQNMIREIRCECGISVTSHSDIKIEAETFFSDFLNQSPQNYQGVSEEELQDMLKFQCSIADCSMLEA